MNRNVTAVILIVLAIAVYVTYTSKLWAENKKIQAINDTYSTAIANADTAITTLDTKAEQYNSVSAVDQDRLNKVLPTSVDNIRLIIDLNSIAFKRGITLKNIAATSPESVSGTAAPTVGRDGSTNTAAANKPELGSVSVSFNVSTNYNQFIQFLRDVEADLRIMDLTKMSVKSSNSGQYDYSLDFKTYWLK